MTSIMKKLFLALLCIGVLNAQGLKEVSKDKLAQIQKLNLIKKAKIEVNKAYDLGSLYILDSKIQGNSQELFLTKDSKILIAGNVMDANSGKPITLPIDLSITKGKEALTYGTGSDEYILFTDPECPYCKKFESFFPQIKDKVKIKVFFFPLSFHKNAKDLSIYYMSKKTNEAKIKTMMSVDAKSAEFINRKIDAKTLKNLEAKLKEQITIAQSLNISGTPTLFNKNGEKVVWVELLQKYNVKVK